VRDFLVLPGSQVRSSAALPQNTRKSTGAHRFTAPLELDYLVENTSLDQTNAQTSLKAGADYATLKVQTAIL
jgi:hypothetical protein